MELVKRMTDNVISSNTILAYGLFFIPLILKTVTKGISVAISETPFPVSENSDAAKGVTSF